ncbi:hypothetical protein LLG10_07475 [bacterium]|nr:hypothetical protein [bacterium]
MRQEAAGKILTKRCQYCDEWLEEDAPYCLNCGRSFLIDSSNPYLDFLHFLFYLSLFLLLLILLFVWLKQCPDSHFMR